MTNLIASTAYTFADETGARDVITFMLNDDNRYVTAENTPMIVLVEAEATTGDMFAVVCLDSDGSEIEDMDIASGDALAAWKETLPATTEIIDIECFTVTTPGPARKLPARTPSRLLCGVAYQLR